MQSLARLYHIRTVRSPYTSHGHCIRPPHCSPKIRDKECCILHLSMMRSRNRSRLADMSRDHRKALPPLQYILCYNQSLDILNRTGIIRLIRSSPHHYRPNCSLVGRDSNNLGRSIRSHKHNFHSEICIHRDHCMEMLHRQHKKCCNKFQLCCSLDIYIFCFHSQHMHLLLQDQRKQAMNFSKNPCMLYRLCTPCFW